MFYVLCKRGKNKTRKICFLIKALMKQMSSEFALFFEFLEKTFSWEFCYYRKSCAGTHVYIKFFIKFFFSILIRSMIQLLVFSWTENKFVQIEKKKSHHNENYNL